MRWLTRWLPARRPANTRPTRRGLLTLESLDRRDLPALLFVVNGSVGADATHFHSLSDALGNASTGDVIQIEPNSSPGAADGTSSTNTANKTLTIQGDLANGALNLPQVTSLVVSGTGVVLNNLNLGVLNASGTGLRLTNSLVGQTTLEGGSNGSGAVFNGDTFTGTVSLGGTVSNNVQVTNNVFTSSLATVLEVAQSANALISANVFTSSGNSTAITSSSSTNVTIQHNFVAYTGSAAIGVEVVGTGNASVLDNTLDTNGTGNGITILKNLVGTLTVKIEGNDLEANKVGVYVTGDGTSGNTALGTIDAGAGALGSLGGNNFKGFTGTSGHFAIQTTNSANSTANVAAEFNTFSNGTAPASAVSAANSTIDVTNALTPAAGYVDSLYTSFLGRAGNAKPAGEVNGWVNFMAGGGSQIQVSLDIAHSNEANTLLVAGIYQKVLGRAMAGNEGSGWVNLLNHGGTEEQIVAGFLASPEFAARVPKLIDAPTGNANYDFVQSLYSFLLGRTGSAAEINPWVNVVLSKGRANVAATFLNTTEFRDDMVQAMYFGAPNVRGNIPLAGLVPNLVHQGSAPSSGDQSGWVNTGLDLINLEATIAAAAQPLPKR